MIIVDTNLLPELEKTDIFKELKKFSEFGEIVLFEGSLRELKKLKKSKLILEIIKRNKIKIIKTRESYVDNAILNNADPKKDAVATNDKKLIKKLKLKNVNVIRLRQRRYFVLE